MPKYSVKKPFTILVAVILVLVLGFVSLTGIQTDLLPAMNLPYLMVITTYPGASPEQVEADVTKPLENALSTLNGVKNVTRAMKTTACSFWNTRTTPTWTAPWSRPAPP